MKKIILNPRLLDMKNKSTIQQWREDFEKLRSQILTSTDTRRENYSHSMFNIDEQEEISLLMLKGKIVAFSSLYSREHYPRGVFRALNRTWKDPYIRYVNRSYWLLSRQMLLPQIEKAKSLRSSAIFISTEGKRRRWLQRWVSEAQKENPAWTILPHMYQVAPCDSISCWQNVAYLPLQKGFQLKFPFILFNDWGKKFARY